MLALSFLTVIISEYNRRTHMNAEQAQVYNIIKNVPRELRDADMCYITNFVRFKVAKRVVGELINLKLIIKGYSDDNTFYVTAASQRK